MQFTGQQLSCDTKLQKQDTKVHIIKSKLLVTCDHYLKPTTCFLINLTVENDKYQK